MVILFRFLTVYEKSDVLYSCICLGPNYIRPNQSYLYPNIKRDRLIKRQYESMINNMVSHMIRVHHIPSKATVIQQLSEQLKTYLHRQYTNPISYLHIYRTQQELKLIQSIRKRLKQSGQILRVTDKGGIFHIGDVQDYERKVEAYRLKTQAYEELDNNPFSTVFDKVAHLLHDLRSKKQIMAYQLEKMLPKRDKVTLAYLYFVPKPHKVILLCIHHLLFLFLCIDYLTIGRYTTTTYCFVD